MKVLICGGHDYYREDTIVRTLDEIHAETPITCLIEGGANGADTLAYNWAKARGVPDKSFPADWNKHGKNAGPKRNQVMLKQGAPDLVVAFPGGASTAHMVKLARSSGVRVMTVAD